MKTRNDLAQSFKGRGIELGVAKGVFSDIILQNNKVTKLVSIDRWSDHHTLDEYIEVIRLLKVYDERSSVTRSSFEMALPSFTDGTLDFIYIDGYAHQGQERGKTLSDWWPKLKKGGLFCGHDYHRRWPATIEAVNRFMEANNLSISVTQDDEYPSWWVVK